MKPYTDDQLEVDLRHALDDGDPERAAMLGAEVDRRDVKPQPVTLHAAALYYVSVGLRVFPLTPGTKIPLKGSRGCLDATSDPDQINAWWTRTPEANIGIATGHLVDVVDIDGLEGQTSRADLWDKVFADIDAENLGKVSTPTPGGMHVYVAADGTPNGTHLAPSVDYRGAGGYVVAPPSSTPDGVYRWLGPLRLTGDVA